jgi:hypothetical protein
VAVVPGFGRNDRKEQTDGRKNRLEQVRADGTPATVYVNKQLEVVSVQTGMPGPPRSA